MAVAATSLTEAIAGAEPDSLVVVTVDAGTDDGTDWNQRGTIPETKSVAESNVRSSSNSAERGNECVPVEPRLRRDVDELTMRNAWRERSHADASCDHGGILMFF